MTKSLGKVHYTAITVTDRLTKVKMFKIDADGFFFQELARLSQFSIVQTSLKLRLSFKFRGKNLPKARAIQISTLPDDLYQN